MQFELNKEEQEKLPEIFQGVFTAKKILDTLNANFVNKRSNNPFTAQDIQQYCYLTKRLPKYLGGYPIERIEDRVFIFKIFEKK